MLPHARDDFALPPEVYASAARADRRRHPAGRARRDGAQGVHRRSRPRCRRSRRKIAAAARAPERRLPRRDPRAQEGADRRRRRSCRTTSSASPRSRRSSGASTWSRSRRARRASASARRRRTRSSPRRTWSRRASSATRGEQGEFVLPLSIPAPTGSKEAEQKYDDFTYARGVVDADGARGAPRARAAVRLDGRARRVARARALRLQQRQRRRVGALLRGHHAPVHAARGAAHQPAAPPAARRARVPRSRAAAGQVDVRVGARLPARRGRAVAGVRDRGGRALHVPRARAGDVVFLRLHPAAARCATRSRRSSARGSMRRRSTTRSSARGSCRRICCARRCSAKLGAG